jgi:probable regulatory domain-containing protein
VVITLGGITVPEKEIEAMATRVFFKAIDLLGGLKKLAEYRSLTWLPALARTSIAVVMREEYLKTEEEIASMLGIGSNSVKTMLRADPNLALEKIKNLQTLAEEEKRDLKVHTAGGIAKLAYKMVKEGSESQVLMEFARSVAQEALEICEVPWAYAVLKGTRGVDYPVTSAEELKDKLKNIKVKGHPIEDLLEHLSYPLRNPAHLLKEIKKAAESLS